MTPGETEAPAESQSPPVRVAVLSADTGLLRDLCEAMTARALEPSSSTLASMAAAGFNPHVIAFDAETIPVETLARCRPRLAGAKSLVLGSMEPRRVIQGFAAGANAWMLRDEPPDAIALAAELLARGVPTLSTPLLQFFLSLANVDSEHGRKLRERAGLSPRQFEVLSMAACGMTDHEIADRLVLSIRTVNRHMSDILATLHVTDRNEASRLLLDDSPSNVAAQAD
jgi:DNA-binding NarL/FixJ family response regulator